MEVLVILANFAAMGLLLHWSMKQDSDISMGGRAGLFSFVTALAPKKNKTGERRRSHRHRR
jgi:hypothetical protein